MDWQQVKEQVTAEVLKQLKAEGVKVVPDASAPAAGAAQPAATATPSSAAPASAPAAAPAVTAIPDLAPAMPVCNVGDDFKTEVLVCVAGSAVTERLLAAIRDLAATKKVTVIGSNTNGASLVGVQACGQLYCDGNEAIARRLVQGADMIAVPLISTNTAAKVSSLISDCFPATVLIQAALTGKKVVVAKEGLAVPEGATWAVRRKIEEIAGGLKALGFTVTTLDGLKAAVAGKQTAPGGSRVGGFVPAYRPPVSSAAGDYDREMAKMIDHTLLKPEASSSQIIKLCNEARDYGFWSVCVNPGWVPLCANLLRGSGVQVCTVIGFPLGATSSAAKAAEAADAVKKGATEVDMVLNVGATKSGDFTTVLEDMKAVKAAVQGKALVKVILETALLTNEEKVKTCELAKAAGLDFVKTSTGFGPSGATVEDIALMRKTVGPNMGVKASGGIRDYDTALAMVKAGASRIGVSASVQIVKRVKAQPAAKDKY